MMTTINAFLAAKGIYLLTLLLLSLGVAGVIVCNNYMKKLICMNVMQVAVIFFFLCFGQKDPGTIPVAMNEAVRAAEYINPLPHGLMLTAIVVSLGTTGVGLSLLLRIREKYGTIEEDDLLRKQAVQARKEKKKQELHHPGDEMK
jgi:multicomponent Na+:H+ antiporter subunit C